MTEEKRKSTRESECVGKKEGGREKEREKNIV